MVSPSSNFFVELHDVPKPIQLEALNKLLTDKTLEVLQQKSGALLYRLRVTKSSAPTDIENDEQIIYNIIEEGANQGVWIRDIRTKSNLAMTQLNKILKALESKKLIKSVKSVNQSKKKVFMLYNLEPDSSVSGGAWYSEQDFEAEFVEVLSQQCLKFLQKRREQALKTSDGPKTTYAVSCCTVAEVRQYITELKIIKVSLKDEDFDMILKTIFYDGNAERILQSDGSYLYRAVNTPLEVPGFAQIPCGTCTIISRCSDKGEITAKNCAYMNEWLDM